MNYNEINKRKKAFIFELDDVLYPQKDYVFQVYYLFAGLLEYTTLTDAKKITNILTDAWTAGNSASAFDKLQKELGTDEKYRLKLDELMINAKLPLKLLLFKDALNFLQDIVVDRKQLFIVTNGNPVMQLNKIKQTEWHGLEQYFKVYFAEEMRPMPETDVIDMLLADNALLRKDIVVFGKSPESRLCAANAGIDFVAAEILLTA